MWDKNKKIKLYFVQDFLNRVQDDWDQLILMIPLIRLNGFSSFAFIVITRFETANKYFQSTQYAIYDRPHKKQVRL